MSHHKFEIELSGEYVTGRHLEVVVAGGRKQTVVRQEFGEQPAAKIATDPLTLRTARLMEDWLNNWDRIARTNLATCNQLLSASTLETMGSHLWRLILDNEVGAGLLQIAARLPGHRLQVLITIDGDVGPEIAGLPWEFLYHAGTEREDGFFLAARSDLILTRYVNAQVPVVRPVRQRQTLRVLFLVALPDEDRFAVDRLRIINLAKQLLRTCPLEVVTFTDSWDSPEREELFSEDANPFHVIHVVGLCRGTVWEPKIYLPTGNTGQWVDPRPLVDVLTRRVGEQAAPGLVVLELCDDDDGDATENFERLAPSLIRAGTPAVLAMQYPLPSEGGFAEHLYRRLTRGMEIGEAVQDIRQEYANSPQASRLFGAPVLYLHEDGALVGEPPKEVRTTTLRTDTSGRAAKVRKRFLARIDLTDLDEDEEQGLKEWVNSTDWSVGLNLSTRRVRDRGRHQVTPKLKQLFQEFLQDLDRLAIEERSRRAVRRSA